MPTNTTCAALVTTLAERKFLAFNVANIEYVIDILSVRDVCAYQVPEPLSMSGANAVFTGLIRVDDRVVPVVDLRDGKQPVQDALSDPAIVLIHVREHVVGLVVDQIVGIVALTEEELRPLAGANALLGADNAALLKSTEATRVLLTMPTH